MPASSLAVTVAALGAHQQAHRHASHRTGHHNGNRRTTMTLQHADIEHVARSGEHARDGHRQNARLHRNHAPSLASPAPPCLQTFLQVRRAETTQGQHDSPVTCAPVGGQHAAQCMAACPPPPRGAARVWVGASPRPSTPIPLGTATCGFKDPRVLQQVAAR